MSHPSVKPEDREGDGDDDMHGDDELDFDTSPIGMFGDGGIDSLANPPVPMPPPQAISPTPEERERQIKEEVPAFFLNNGLIMRNTDGHVHTNTANLPIEKSFTIQVGPEQFRLSGASINSDAPSYFSRFFETELAKRAAQNTPASEPIRTLYVDRDPQTFRDIALHLQGYHTHPRDSIHYVRLFADAQFYGLPRLIKHLFESDVFIRIGEDEFCVPRDLFTADAGNAPNYFTLGFSLLFSTPGNPFPGLDVAGLLRPPAIKAASASGRSGRIFADILDLLRGYEVRVRDGDHRAALLRDCRYYHLRGLEQRLIPHSLTWNEARKTSEIVLRLEDLRQSGVSVEAIPEPGTGGLLAVKYARPFVDDAESPHELIVETGPDSATIRPANNFVVEFHNEERQRLMSLFKVVMARFASQRAALHSAGGQTPDVFIINQDGMANARIEPDALVTVDGQEGWLVHPSIEGSAESMTVDDDDLVGGGQGKAPKRRKLNDASGEPPPEVTREWTVMRAQWRLRLESWARGAGSQDRSLAIHLYAVNLDVVRGQKGRNRKRGFLCS